MSILNMLILIVLTLCCGLIIMNEISTHRQTQTLLTMIKVEKALQEIQQSIVESLKKWYE